MKLVFKFFTILSFLVIFTTVKATTTTTNKPDVPTTTTNAVKEEIDPQKAELLNTRSIHECISQCMVVFPPKDNLPPKSSSLSVPSSTTEQSTTNNTHMGQALEEPLKTVRNQADIKQQEFMAEIERRQEELRKQLIAEREAAELERQRLEAELRHNQTLAEIARRQKQAENEELCKGVNWFKNLVHCTRAGDSE